MTIPLSELNGELRPLDHGGEEAVEALWFTCPLCDAAGEEHWHVVPFRRGVPTHGDLPGLGNVWGHRAGSRLEDLTLAPSYLSHSPRRRSTIQCRLHAYVRNGELQVLGDSVRC